MSFQRRHAHNYYIMGRRRADNGAWSEARLLLERALSFDPDYLPALRSMASVELSLGHHDGAWHFIQRSIALEPNDHKSYFLLGNVALNEQNPRAALDAYQKALEYGGSSHDLSYNTGLAHLMLMQGDEAARIFSALVTEQPMNPRAWDALGCALRLLKDYTNAVNAFVQALHLEPKLNDAREHLAQLLMETGNPHRASQVLESAITLEPDRGSCRHLLGMAYASLQNFEKAIECWETVLAQGQGNAECYHLLANAYLRLEKDQQAQTALEALVESFPAHLPGRIQLALLCFEHGECEAGYRHLDCAREIDPTNAAIEHALLTAHILCPRTPSSPDTP